MTETDKLAVVPKGMEGMISADRPEGKDEGTLGNEGITRDDILIPRLALAQKMSPEIDPTNVERRIPGLEFTDMYHSLTRQNFGKGPLHFVILKREDPRWVEFVPIDEGGGIRDRNVPADDPRTQFGADGEKPIATMFYDFIVLLLTGFNPASPLESVIALSFKSSGLKAAKQLNMYIQQRGPKMIYKGVYELTTGSATDKKTSGVYAIYKVKNAGWLVHDSPIEKIAAEMFEAWKDREVKIDVEQTAEPEVSEAYEAPEPAEM